MLLNIIDWLSILNLHSESVETTGFHFPPSDPSSKLWASGSSVKSPPEYERAFLPEWTEKSSPSDPLIDFIFPLGPLDTQQEKHWENMKPFPQEMYSEINPSIAKSLNKHMNK